MKRYVLRISTSTRACNTFRNQIKRILKSISGVFQRNIWEDTYFVVLKSPTSQKSIATLMDQAVISATNFLTCVIISRASSKEELGLYLLGFSIVLFVLGVQQSLISSPYTVFSQRLKGNEHATYTGSTIIHQLGISAITILSLTIGGAAIFYSSIGPIGLALVIRVLAIVILFILLREYCRRVCFAWFRFKTPLVLDFCIAIIQLSGLLLLARYGWLSASRAFLVIGAACGVVAIGWLITNWKEFDPQLIHTWKDLWRNWSFGKWVLAGNMVFLMSSQLYPWFLAWLHGSAMTGVLAACLSIVGLANPLLLAAGNYLGPRTAQAFGKGLNEVRSVVTKATLVVAAAMSLLCLAILIFGDQIVLIIYGREYAGNHLVLFLLVLGIFSWALSLPISYGLWAIERPDLNFKVNLIAIGMTLSIGFWLVKAFGLLGVACGILIGNISSSAARYIIFSQLIGKSLSGK